MYYAFSIKATRWIDSYSSISEKGSEHKILFKDEYARVRVKEVF